MSQLTRIAAIVAVSWSLSAVGAEAGQSCGCQCYNTPRCKTKRIMAHLNALPPLFSFCPGTERSVWDRIRFGRCTKIGCQACCPEGSCHQRYMRYCQEYDPCGTIGQPAGAGY